MHLVYPGELSADFYVLSWCLQAFRKAFDCAINDGERWRGCRDTVEGGTYLVEFPTIFTIYGCVDRAI